MRLKTPPLWGVSGALCAVNNGRRTGVRASGTARACVIPEFIPGILFTLCLYSIFRKSCATALTLCHSGSRTICLGDGSSFPGGE